jgi:hypothetical protein
MKRCMMLILASAAVLAETPFAWQAQVEADASAPYYRLTVPVEAYLKAAQPGLADLRVFNAEGAPVAFARIAPSGSREERVTRTALRWFPLREAASGADGKLDVTVRQSRDGALLEVHARSGQTPDSRVSGYLLDASALTQREGVRALTLDWQGEVEGFQLLDLEASDNLQDWRSVQRHVQLARLDFNGERIERRRIELAGLSGRYLKLRWRDPAVAPTLTHAEIEQSSAQWQSPALAWSSAVLPVDSPLNLQAGEYHYRLESAVPVSRIRLDLPAGNALLPLQILQPTRERRHWQSVARGVVYRINSNQREWMQDEIALDGQWLKEFIVRVDPRSGRALNAPALYVGIAPEQVVFLAEGAAPYRLAVGNGQMRNAALPLSTLVPGLGSANAPQIAKARLASATVSATFASSPASAGPQADWKKAALWGVLLAGVLLMAGMAWQLLRQMNKKS